MALPKLPSTPDDPQLYPQAISIVCIVLTADPTSPLVKYPLASGLELVELPVEAVPELSVAYFPFSIFVAVCALSFNRMSPGNK